MYKLRNTTKQKVLLEQDRRIFRATHLAILWDIQNTNTLHTTIHRYVKRGILHRLFKGLYSTISISKLHPFELGCAISGAASYISTETVLQTEGIIMQSVNKITLMGRKTIEYTFNDTTYLCRYLHPRYLLNREGIIEQSRFTIASTERAIADIQHLNPKYYFDNQLAINQNTVNTLTVKLGYS